MAVSVPPSNIRLEDLVEIPEHGGRWHFPYNGGEDGGEYSSIANHEWLMAPTDAPASRTDEFYGRPSTVYYDPARTQVSPGEFRHEYTNKGNRITDLNPPAGMLWRGMSDEEYQAAVQNGYFESPGEYNIGGESQVGKTYFSTGPDHAESYANGFAPWQYRPTFTRPGHIIGIPDRPDIPREGGHEVGIPGRIPFDEAVHHYVGHPYAIAPGTYRGISNKYDGQWDEVPPYRSQSANAYLEWEDASPVRTVQAAYAAHRWREGSQYFFGYDAHSAAADGGFSEPVNQLMGRLHQEFTDWATPLHDKTEWPHGGRWAPEPKDLVGEWPWVERFLKERYPAAHQGFDMGREEARPAINKRKDNPYPTGSEAIAQYGYDPKEIAAGMLLLHIPDGTRHINVPKNVLNNIFKQRQQMQEQYRQRTAMPNERDVYDDFYDEDEYSPDERPDPHDGPWYHYSPSELPVGTHLTPGHASPWGDDLYAEGTGHRRDYVWLSPTVTDAAGWAEIAPRKGNTGRGHIYRVNPSSGVLPWNGTGSDGWVADGAHIVEELTYPWKEPHAREDFGSHDRDVAARQRTAAVNQELVDSLSTEFNQWWDENQKSQPGWMDVLSDHGIDPRDVNYSEGEFGSDDDWDDDLTPSWLKPMDPVTDKTERGPIGFWPHVESFLKDRYPAAYRNKLWGYEGVADLLDVPDLVRGDPYETGPEAIDRHGYDPREIASGMLLLHNRSDPLRGDLAEEDLDRLTDIFDKRQQMQRDYEKRQAARLAMAWDAWAPKIKGGCQTCTDGWEGRYTIPQAGAFLNYAHATHQGQPAVKVIGIYTHPSDRGDGVAEALMRRLADDHPGAAIIPGMMTTDGQHFHDRMLDKEPTARDRVTAQAKTAPDLVKDYTDSLSKEFHDWAKEQPYVPVGFLKDDPLVKNPDYSQPMGGPLAYWENIEGFLQDRYPAVHRGFAYGQESAAATLDGQRVNFPPRHEGFHPPYETGPEAAEKYGYDPRQVAAGFMYLHSLSHSRAQRIPRDIDRLSEIFQKRQQMQRDYEQRQTTAARTASSLLVGPEDAYDEWDWFKRHYENPPSSIDVTTKDWYHVSPHRMPVGTVLAPMRGDTPWNDSPYDHGLGNRANWVWVEFDKDKARQWSRYVLQHQPECYIYRVEPELGPFAWNGTADEGWVTTRARVTEYLDRISRDLSFQETP